MKSIGIFPAAGGLGGSTYRHLLKLVPTDHVTLICRYPEKVEKQYVDAGVTVRKATYEHSPPELEAVFKGLDVLFLVSYPSHVHEYRTKVSEMIFLSQITGGLKSPPSRYSFQPSMQLVRRVSSTSFTAVWASVVTCRPEL